MHVPTEFQIKMSKNKKSTYSLISPIIAHQKYHVLEDRHILQFTKFHRKMFKNWKVIKKNRGRGHSGQIFQKV